MEDSHKIVINESGIEKEDGVRLILYSADLSSELPLDFADGGIRAGFPSPAQDYMTESIDLNRELVRHPATTFYAWKIQCKLPPKTKRFCPLVLK